MMSMFCVDCVGCHTDTQTAEEQRLLVAWHSLPAATIQFAVTS